MTMEEGDAAENDQGQMTNIPTDNMNTSDTAEIGAAAASATMGPAATDASALGALSTSDLAQSQLMLDGPATASYAATGASETDFSLVAEAPSTKRQRLSPDDNQKESGMWEIADDPLVLLFVLPTFVFFPPP